MALPGIRRIVHSQAAHPHSAFKSFDATSSRLDLSASLNTERSEQKESTDEVLERWRVSWKKCLSSSTFGVCYEAFNVAISTLSALQCIYLTYIRVDTDGGRMQMDLAVRTNAALVTAFAGDWLLNLFLADNRVAYLASFFSVVDLVTVGCTCTILSTRQLPVLTSASTFSDCALYGVHVLSNVRILRALRLWKPFVCIEDAVTRYLAQTCLCGLVFILFFAAIEEMLERHTSGHAFHTWMYYVWVTVATVGYGDITPQTLLGRTTSMIMIGVAVVSVPKVTNELIEKMNLQSVYMRASYVPRSRNSKHVVICGDLGSTALKTLFEELFHDDHDNHDLDVVLLLPLPPSVETKLLLRAPQYAIAATYLQGSALVKNDLRRAKTEAAESVFIMTNKFSSNPDEDDARSILLNLSIKRYLPSLRRTRMQFCTQLIRPENRRLLAKNDVHDLEERDLVVCLNEIKMGTMAKAVVCRGANTLIMNLVTSFSNTQFKDRDGSPLWLREYEKGCEWEIYVTHLSSAFQGANFCELSYALFDCKGILLFALEIADRKDDSQPPRVVLNPANYTIPSKEEFTVKAFVIAKDQSSSDLSCEWGVGLGHSAYALSRRLAMIHPAGLAVLGDGKNKWDVLKRGASQDKSLASQSYQEVLTGLEDDHFQNTYHTLQIPADLSDVTVKHSIFEELPFIDQHLIVLGKDLRNLYDFICPLRAKHLPLRYIVLVYPDEIPPDIWQRISVFECIMVVRGVPLEESTLRRAGVFRAAQVVVLADGSAQSKAVGLEALADLDVIFSYQLVKRMNPNAQMLLEVVNESNVAHIGHDRNGDHGGHFDAHRFAPSYAAGNLFTTSFLDSLVCQSYYNPLIVKVVHELISGADQAERSHLMVDAAAIITDEMDSGGNADENPVISSRVRKTLLDVQKKAKSRLSSIQPSYLYQLPVPRDLDGAKTYGTLFQTLSAQGMLPLGILRGTGGCLGNNLPFVNTNPYADSKLYAADCVFVLSPTPIANGGANLADVVSSMENHTRAGTANHCASTCKADLSDADLRRKLSEVVALMTEQRLAVIQTAPNSAPPSACSSPRDAFHHRDKVFPFEEDSHGLTIQEMDEENEPSGF